MAKNDDELITVDILKDRLVKSFQSIPNKQDKSSSIQVIVEQLNFMFSNYEKLTPEAQKIADNMFDEVVSFAEDTTSKLPDSVQTRQLKRLVRGSKGERVSIDAHMDDLEKPRSSQTAFFIKSREFFKKYLQILMDYMQDIVDNTLSGSAIVSQLGLFGVCVDELLVAFHLSNRGYVQQAFAHIRTIDESVDLINLFKIDQAAADFWLNEEDWSKVWKELKPGKVKEKLGSDKIYSELYHFFSSKGSHPTWDMIRMRIKKSAQLSSEKRIQMSISVGGTPAIKEAIFSQLFIMISIIRVMSAMVSCFEKYLNQEEVKASLLTASNDLSDFITKNVLELLKTEMNKEAIEEDIAYFNKLKENTTKIFS